MNPLDERAERLFGALLGEMFVRRLEDADATRDVILVHEADQAQAMQALVPFQLRLQKEKGIFLFLGMRPPGEGALGDAPFTEIHIGYDDTTNRQQFYDLIESHMRSSVPKTDEGENAQALLQKSPRWADLFRTEPKDAPDQKNSGRGGLN